MDKRRDTASEGELVLRTAEPTLDMNHLQRLLGEHLARIYLAGPGALFAAAHAGDPGPQRQHGQLIAR